MAVPGRLRPSGGLNSSRSQLCEGLGNEPRVQWDRVGRWLSHRDEPRWVRHLGVQSVRRHSDPESRCPLKFCAQAPFLLHA